MVRIVMVGVALVIIMMMLTGCDWLMSDQERFDKARELTEHGEYGAASVQLKKLLQSNDNMPQARVLLGKVLLEMGQAGDAEVQLLKARDAGVPLDGYVIELATAYLLQGKYQQITKDFDVPDTSLRPGDIAALNRVRGKAFLAGGQYDQAAQAFNEALQAKPGDPGARTGLALVDMLQQHFGEAETQVDGILKEVPEFAEALLVKGQLALRGGRNEDAADAFSRAIAHHSGAAAILVELQAMVGLVEAHYRQQDLDGAGKAVAMLAKRFPKHPLTSYMQGLINYSKGNYQATVTDLLPLTQSGEAMPGVYFLAGAAHYALDNLEQAQIFLSRAIEQTPTDTNVRKLLALTEMRLGKPERAAEVVQALDDTGSPEAEDMWRVLGGISLRQGDINTGIDYLQRGADSGNPDTAMDLAAAYIVSGRAKLGLEILSRLPDTVEVRQRRDMLEILVYINKKDFGAARSQVEKLVIAYPGNFGVRSLAGSVYMAAGDLALARRHYEAALEIEPDNPGASTNLARLEVAEGNAAAARKRLHGILDKTPGYESAALLLAALYLQEHNTDDAVNVLDKALIVRPDSDRIRVSLLRVAIAQNQIDRVESLARAALERRPHSDFYIRVLVEACLRQNRVKEAEAFLQQEIQTQPGSVQPLFYMARVLSRDGRYDQARQYLKQALALSDGNGVINLELARIDASAGEYARALAEIDVLHQRQPEMAAVYELEGDIYAVQGQFGRSQVAYGKAADLGPSRQLIAKLLGMQEKVGLKPDVQRLNRWVEAHPGDIRAAIMLAQHRQEDGENKMAIALYERILALEPDNLIALNNLAWIYARQGDKRAVDLAEHAHTLAPQRADIIDTYGWVLTQFEQADKAVVLLRQAVELEPEAVEIRHHLAVALNATGKGGEARGILANLLESDRSFEGRSEAEVLYRELR